MTEPINKEAVRVLVQSVGYQLAAQQTGIAYATLRQWAKRGNWNGHVPKTPNNQHTVTRVTKQPGQAHADILQELEQQTRVSLAKYSARASKDAEQCSVKEAPLVHKVAQTAGIVHKWGNQESGSQPFTLNVLNLGSLGVHVAKDTGGVSG